jgi:hypothetical protein
MVVGDGGLRGKGWRDYKVNRHQGGDRPKEPASFHPKNRFPYGISSLLEQVAGRGWISSASAK